MLISPRISLRADVLLLSHPLKHRSKFFIKIGSRFIHYFFQLCITIVFDFSWDDCNVLENLETMVMQNSEGETRCIMVYMKVVSTRDVKRA